MRDGRPAYVTCVGDTNLADGWRDHRADGGVVVDVVSSEIVGRGLSMPHSPRLHRGCRTSERACSANGMARSLSA